MWTKTTTLYASLLPAFAAAVLAGCGTYATQGAAQGAGTGALAGAVGAAATALVFGGDVGDAAARGAVYGGATGAVAGGISGAQTDKRVAAEQQAELDRKVQEFRNEIGNDAFNGFVALAECKYEIALANARQAQKSSERDFALAGFWVEALTEAERGGVGSAGAAVDAIVEKDRDVRNSEEARAKLDSTLAKLSQIRTDFDLPATCDS